MIRACVSFPSKKRLEICRRSNRENLLTATRLFTATRRRRPAIIKRQDAKIRFGFQIIRRGRTLKNFSKKFRLSNPAREIRVCPTKRDFPIIIIAKPTPDFTPTASVSRLRRIFAIPVRDVLRITATTARLRCAKPRVCNRSTTNFVFTQPKPTKNATSETPFRHYLRKHWRSILENLSLRYNCQENYNLVAVKFLIFKIMSF